MCGIFGVITSRNLPIEDMARKGCEGLAHRGPDGSGLYRRGPLCFAHRRLAIIDVAQGAQPMRSPDDRYCVTYNGEIYNHLELREELQQKGYVFHTRSDTETLLRAYEEWGADCLHRLRGMFAFAIADYERQEVFLARDRFGVKPLMYRSEPDFFAFSSELPPLTRMEGLSGLTLSGPAILQFFSYQYIPAPHTVYAQIRKLRPGHALMTDFQGAVLRQWQYWEPIFAPEAMSRGEATARVDAALADSVRAHTLSDVPFGVYLSGGIDSTLIAMNLARCAGKSVPAFTIAFDEEEFSELEYASAAAERLGLDLMVEHVRADDLDMLPEILSHYGEPYGDSSVLPTWHVARLARRHVSVVLSGDAGDELFAGYPQYASWLDVVEQSRQRLAPTPVHPDAMDWQNFFYADFTIPRQAGTLLSPNLARFAGATGHVFGELSGKESFCSPLELAQLLDLRTYLPECLLPKVDVTSMCHGLEVRPPFLDLAVWREAARMPLEHKITAQEKGKAVLKDILLRNGFPPSFVYRRKMGFSIPEARWFLKRGAARRLLLEMLHSQRDVLADFLIMKNVWALLEQHSEQRSVCRNLWLILAFACWVRNSGL